MSGHRALDRDLALSAFEHLDGRVPAGTHLVVGGGAAMILGYKYVLTTDDVDAFTAKGSATLSDIDRAAKAVARQLNLDPQWLNSYFDTYTDVLPSDFKDRLRRIYKGERLTVDVLGPEDLLVMKCFAGRDKDRPHALKLIRLAKDLDVVDRRLTELVEKRRPDAQKAADYFDDLRDEVDR